MEIVTRIDALRARLSDARTKGRRVVFVPTMGNLHAGHMSLLASAKQHGDYIVSSIFVNRLQFAPNEDFDRYPRTFESDCSMLAAKGTHILFAPDETVLYPAPQVYMVQTPQVGDKLEGQFRPGFFRGVATVVLKLFNMAGADVAYFGQKDYQQTLVIKTLVRDFDLPIKVVICPTVREPDGLAMSSRNAYLKPEERQAALALSRALKKAESVVAAGERDVWKVRDVMQSVLAAEKTLRPQYALVADAETLAEPATIEGPCVALVAALGIIAGILPALQAMRLQIAVALRRGA